MRLLFAIGLAFAIYGSASVYTIRVLGIRISHVGASPTHLVFVVPVSRRPVVLLPACN